MAEGHISIAGAKAIIDELVHKLEEDFQREYRMNVSQVVKGGSMGQGIAEPSDFDGDIVLYSRDIDPDDVVRSGVKDILVKLDAFLRKAYGYRYKDEHTTPYALQFTLHSQYGHLDIDLLPSPYWRSADDYHSFLSKLGKRDRRKLQPSEAIWEKYFFQNQPEKVKEYIRRAKAWRNSKWTRGQRRGRPKSFLLALLVTDAYRKSHSKDPASVTRTLQQNVKNHHHLRIHWDQHGALYRQHYVDEYRLLQTPYIIDPANPFNNVYENGLHEYRGREDKYEDGHGDWTKLVEYIDTLDLSRQY